MDQHNLKIAKILKIRPTSRRFKVSVNLRVQIKIKFWKVGGTGPGYRGRDLQATGLVGDGFSHTWVRADVNMVNGNGFSWRRVR